MDTLTKLSDSQIREEYCKRFTIKCGEQITNSEMAADHFRHYITDIAREHFLILFLNGANRVITTEVLALGTLTTATVYPREVIRRVLNNQAGSIILCHNHPSGNLHPSRDDINLTNRLKKACSTIDVNLHDHLIISGDGAYSFADHGLI